MALLLHPGPVPLPALEAALQAHCPGLPVRVWPEVGNPADIRFALVSRIAPGELAKLPRLALIGSLHAGVDHLLRDPALPPHVPLTRPVPPDGDVLMNEYVLAQVLYLHRGMPAFRQAQADARWARMAPVPVRRRSVGFLGFGAMAAPAARLLASVGFDVAAWARRPRPPGGPGGPGGPGAGPDIPVFTGPDGLDRLLARSQILVNLLPLTPATENLVDARLLAQLPRGASFLNVGRGEHLVDADLLAALDAGHIAGAVLDVFRQEPLPADHPLWRHPGVTVTPHACRVVDVHEVVAQFAAELERLRRAMPLVNAVDRAAGY